MSLRPANLLDWDSDTSESGAKEHNHGRLRSDSGYSSVPSSPVKSEPNIVHLTPEENFWLMKAAKDLALIRLKCDSIQNFPLAAEESQAIDCRWESDPVRFDNVVVLRRMSQTNKKKKNKLVTPYCQFCRNNNESDINGWSSHICKDEYDRVVCPVLRKYICPYCDATGDTAHTIRYCPVKKDAELKELEENFKRLH